MNISEIFKNPISDFNFYNLIDEQKNDSLLASRIQFPLLASELWVFASSFVKYALSSVLGDSKAERSPKIKTAFKKIKPSSKDKVIAQTEITKDQILKKKKGVKNPTLIETISRKAKENKKLLLMVGLAATCVIVAYSLGVFSSQTPDQPVDIDASSFNQNLTELSSRNHVFNPNDFDRPNVRCFQLPSVPSEANGYKPLTPKPTFFLCSDALHFKWNPSNNPTATFGTGVNSTQNFVRDHAFTDLTNKIGYAPTGNAHNFQIPETAISRPANMSRALNGTAPFNNSKLHLARKWYPQHPFYISRAPRSLYLKTQLPLEDFIAFNMFLEEDCPSRAPSRFVECASKALNKVAKLHFEGNSDALLELVTFKDVRTSNGLFKMAENLSTSKALGSQVAGLITTSEALANEVNGTITISKALCNQVAGPITSILLNADDQLDLFTDRVFLRIDANAPFQKSPFEEIKKSTERLIRKITVSNKIYTKFKIGENWCKKSCRNPIFYIQSLLGRARLSPLFEQREIANYLYEGSTTFINPSSVEESYMIREYLMRMCKKYTPKADMWACFDKCLANWQNFRLNRKVFNNIMQKGDTYHQIMNGSIALDIPQKPSNEKMSFWATALTSIFVGLLPLLRR